MTPRYLWLLALPYVVTITHPCTEHSVECLARDATSYAIIPIGLEWKDKEVADDMAEALNEAHERRSRYLKEIIPPHTGINKHDDYLGIYGESK